jgi:hypothetical protein
MMISLSNASTVPAVDATTEMHVTPILNEIQTHATNSDCYDIINVYMCHMTTFLYSHLPPPPGPISPTQRETRIVLLRRPQTDDTMTEQG